MDLGSDSKWLYHQDLAKVCQESFPFLGLGRRLKLTYSRLSLRLPEPRIVQTVILTLAWEPWRPCRRLTENRSKLLVFQEV